MTTNTAPVILWFRQDLRIHDNPALDAAVKSGAPVLALFIDDNHHAQEWTWGGASRWWLHHSLKALQTKMGALGGTIRFFKGDSAKILPVIAQETHAQQIFWNRLYEPFAIERDTQIKSELKDRKHDVQTFQATILHEPWTIKNKSGKPFQVYTPFSKACFERADHSRPLPTPEKITGFQGTVNGEVSLDNLGLLPTIKWDGGFYEEWTPGEDGAFKRFDHFMEHAIQSYKEDRNRPDLPFVSRLSPHIHWGEISLRQIWHRVEHYIATAQNTSHEENAIHFQKELLWREFSHHLLYHFKDLPDIPLNKKFFHFPWNDNDAWLARWQKGQTGYPIIDAGMRELWHTGWMHNRVRMIVGSFLVKNLRLHWHHGEKWFWDTLVDADLANNSASWQWIAGCGADAAPYFRVFNPVLQGHKFDPKGDYVRKWVPEIARLPDRFIHEPWQAPALILRECGITLDKDYPSPIVDLAKSRDEALSAFKTLKEGA